MAKPPVFAFVEALLFWAVLAWSFVPEMHYSGIWPRVSSTPQDAGTLRLFRIGINVALAMAFLLSFLPWLAMPQQRFALYAGTVLLFLGSLLRRYCFRVLGEYFTPTVTVSAGQPVIDSGPYHWIRHPGYTAGFLIYVGIGVALGNWLGLSILVAIACYVYSRRVRAEEAAMLDTIGDPYRVYMARTKRFIPFIF